MDVGTGPSGISLAELSMLSKELVARERASGSTAPERSLFEDISTPASVLEVNKPRSRRLECAVGIFLFFLQFAITAYVGISIVLPFFGREQSWMYDHILSVLAGFAIVVSLYVFQIGWGAFQWTKKYRLVKDANWYERWRVDYGNAGRNSNEVYHWKDIHHFVLVTAYKEPVEMLRLLAYALMSQQRKDLCKKQITLVLAMEEREGETAREKGRILQEELRPFFREVFCTFHPADLPGEIKGKASNYKWAVKKVEEYIQADGKAAGLSEDRCLIHVADADSLYDPNYFPNVTYHFCTDPHRYEYVWQPCMLPSCNFWELAAPCRQVNTMIAAQEMMAAYAKMDVQIPFSTHGMALKTLQLIGNGSAADAQDGDVIAEDHHLFIKGFFALEGRLKIHPIYLPCLNFAVGGEAQSLWSNMKDRFVQAKRHMFGITELIYLIAILLRGGWCCRRTTYTKTGAIRTFGLFLKFFKVHSIPYLSLWVALGLILILVLKVQKAICESTAIDEETKKPICDNNLSAAADLISAVLFTVVTTVTLVGSMFIIFAFTKMLHATHYTLRNIADPHGSFMDGIWEALGSPRNSSAASPLVGGARTAFGEDGTNTSFPTSPSTPRKEESDSPRKRESSPPPSPTRPKRPMIVGAGFPWVGTFLQLAAEFAILGFFTSFVYGTIPAVWALGTFIKNGHTLEYVTAPKPGSAANDVKDTSKGSNPEKDRAIECSSSV
jgi:hypothetical protein